MRTKCNSSFNVIQRTKWKPSGYYKKIEKTERKDEQKTNEENKKVGDQKIKDDQSGQRLLNQCGSKSTSRTLQTQKSCFSIFPDVPWCFHLRHLLHVSTFPRCPVCSSDSFTFTSFLPLKLLPNFHFTPRAFTQLPVSHSRKNVVRFVSFSRVSTVRLSGKFRTVIAVPATLEPAASPPFPFFPTLPSNAILVVDPTQIDDRLCRLAIVHRPTINPHGWSSGVHRARTRQTFRRVEGQWHSDHTHRRLVKSRRNCNTVIKRNQNHKTIDTYRHLAIAKAVQRLYDAYV